MKRSKLISFFQGFWGKDFLKKWQAKDEFGANGFQVEGAEEIKKIALGVSLNQDWLNQALYWGADTCIFHHGLDLVFPQKLMPGYLQGRLKSILENNLNIFGFHGVMDAHPKYGHSALILKKLGAQVLGTIFDEWGWYGDFKEKKKLITIGNRCHDLFDNEVFVVGKPEQLIKRIGVVSGGGLPSREELANLVAKEIDLYVSGVISESRPHLFSESGLAYFACGHYATEKIGVLELEKNLKKAFPGLKIKFIDIPNPL